MYDGVIEESDSLLCSTPIFVTTPHKPYPPMMTYSLNLVMPLRMELVMCYQ